MTKVSACRDRLPHRRTLARGFRVHATSAALVCFLLFSLPHDVAHAGRRERRKPPDAGLLHLTAEDRAGIYSGPNRTPGLSLRGILYATETPLGMGLSTERLVAHEVPVPRIDLQLRPARDGGFFPQHQNSGPAGMDYTGYGLTGDRYAFQFGRLQIGKIVAADRYADVTKTINTRFEDRSRLSSLGDSFGRLDNPAGVAGLRQSDFSFASTPVEGMSLSAAGSRFQFAEGLMELSARRLNWRGVEVKTSSRHLAPEVQAGSLTAIGRKELAGQIGTSTDDIQARWQIGRAATLQHYQSESATGAQWDHRSHANRDTLDLNLSRALSFHLTDETTTTSSPEAATTTAGSEVFRLTHRDGKKTVTTLTRRQARLRQGEKTGDSTTSAMEIKTKPSRHVNLAASMSNTRDTSGDVAQSSSLAVDSDLSKRLHTTMKTAVARTELNGVVQDHAMGVNIGPAGKPRVALTLGLQENDGPATDRDTRSLSSNLRLVPVRRVELEILHRDTDTSADSRDLTHYITRARVSPGMNLVFRYGENESRKLGDTTMHGVMVDLTPARRHTVQAGFETSQRGRAERTLSFLNSEVKPFQPVKLRGGLMNRSDPGDDDLASWTLGSEVRIFRHMTLEAARAHNKPGSKLAEDTFLIPVAASYQPVEESAYKAALDLTRKWKLTAGLLQQDDLKQDLQMQDTSLGVTYDHGTRSRLELSMIQRQKFEDEKNSLYHTVRLSFVHRTGDHHEFALTGYYNGEDPRALPGKLEAKGRVDVALRLRF